MLETIKMLLDENFTEDAEIYLGFLEEELLEEFDKLKEEAYEIRSMLAEKYTLKALELFGVKMEIPVYDEAALLEELNEVCQRMKEIVKTKRAIDDLLRALGYQVNAEVIPFPLNKDNYNDENFLQ